jgi:hypothetical protein
VGANYLPFTIGNAAAASGGAVTLAAMVRFGAGNNNGGAISIYNSGATAVRALGEAALNLYGLNDFSSGVGPLTQGSYYIIVQTKAAGANPWRMHYWLYNASGTGAFTHAVAVGASNQTDPGAATGGTFRVGANAVAQANGDVAWVAIWDSALSDAAIDSGKTANLSDWAALAPKELVQFENWNGTAGHVVAIGTSTLGAAVGSNSAGTNPTSYNFAAGGADVIFTDTSGGAAGARSDDPLARTFVDASGGQASGGSGDTLARTFVDGSGGAAGGGSADTLSRAFVDQSGGSAGGGSADALARTFVDASGGAAGAGSTDTLAPSTIYTDTSGGTAGAGSPDPSAAPTVKQDTMVMPILTQALQCLRDQAAVAPNVPAYFHLRPGADFEQQADQYGDECCDGIGWVRMAANYEGSDENWMEPNGTPSNCPPNSWAVVIEIGLMRCIPLARTARGERVTDAQWTAATQQQMDDAATLRRVLCCLRDAFDQADVTAGQIGPLPNSGGCGGVTIQVTIRADACDTCT